MQFVNTLLINALNNSLPKSTDLRKLSRMGNWQLEVAKMALYVTFPVALFHYFNQPEYFENWVTKTKQEIYPRNMAEDREKMQEAFAEIRKKQELRYLKELENKATQ